MNALASIGLALAVLVLGVKAAPAQSVRRVYLNAKIYTASDEAPTAEAMATENGRIVGIGSKRDVLPFIDEGVEIVDVSGRVILPGLIDAHAHMMGLGQLKVGVIDLAGTKSYEEVIDRVRARADAVPRGTWILGRGWDHELWPSGELPTHQLLSDAVPDHPVWLSRVDGHAALANAAAMKAAGIDDRTPSPEGGEILRGDDGRATGIFVDNAQPLIEGAVPPHARGEDAELILAAQDMCLSAGLTGVHDMGVSPETVEVYKQLAADGRLKMRMYVLVPGQVAIEYFAQHGIYVSGRVTVRACKLYMDGALGSRGAWLLEPYADRPVDRDGDPYVGLNVVDPLFVDKVAKDANDHGYQVCTHAIGDRANRRVLDAYEFAQAIAIPATSAAGESAGETTGPGAGQPLGSGLLHARNNRFRIEHAQLLDAADIPRFEDLGVLPSMQPTHCTTDMRWIEERIGRDRTVGAYAWRSLIDSGVPIASGSDFPVESHNPFLGIYAAVTRQDLEGAPAGGWHPEQRMTRAEALKSFTIWAAYAAFEEDEKGTLEVGKLADFVVIDRDIMTCEAGLIPDTKVLKTVIGGETVYEGE
ncbi:MAG: amidohydrolase [Phycisphaerales bacterium]